MYYEYVAYTSDKKLTKGTQVAANPEIAARILASHGFKVLSLRAVPAFLPKWELVFPSLFKVSTQAIITFSRQLALLHESGMDIVASLELLRMQGRSRRFREVLGLIVADIRKGDRLSEALGKHPDCFSKIYVQSVTVGEQTGNIETVLRQMADHVEKELKASKAVKNAMKYPAIVVVVAIAVIIVLISVVFPAFMGLYKSLNAEMPGITRATMLMVAWLNQSGVFILVGLVIFGVLVYLWSRTAQGRLQRDRLVMKLPLLGRVVHLNEIIRCCRSISILYRAGLPVPEILILAIETSNNTQMKQALVDVHQKVLKGEGLSRPMSANPVFLPMMVQMVGVGEATGNLDGTLMATADTYETEAEDRMQNIIGLIQPTITLVLAVVVAGIALSLVSAMYSIYGQVG